jgi:hypothetical protein
MSASGGADVRDDGVVQGDLYLLVADGRVFPGRHGQRGGDEPERAAAVGITGEADQVDLRAIRHRQPGRGA